MLLFSLQMLSSAVLLLQYRDTRWNNRDDDDTRWRSLLTQRTRCHAVDGIWSENPHTRWNSVMPLRVCCATPIGVVAMELWLLGVNGILRKSCYFEKFQGRVFTSCITYLALIILYHRCANSQGVSSYYFKL